MGKLCGASRSVCSISSRKRLLSPTMLHSLCIFLSIEYVSCFPARLGFSFKKAIFERISSRFSGFSMKSRAPFWIASIAIGIVPNPDMIMISWFGNSFLICGSSSRPLQFGMKMSSRTRSGTSSPMRCSAFSLPDRSLILRVSTR